MQRLDRRGLQTLLEVRQTPSVSLYMPLQEATNRADVDRLRFRNLLEETHHQLQQRFDQQLADQLLEKYVPLTETTRFWRQQAGGLALLVSPELERMYRLGQAVEARQIIGDNFHTRPLLEYLQMPDRYWVLVLSQQQAALWEGTHEGLSRLHLDGVPEDLLEDLGYEIERDTEIIHRGKQNEGGQAGNPGGGYNPAFPGHGDQQEETRAEMESFFRTIDEALQEHLTDEVGPVILAGTDRHQALYRTISSLPQLADQGVSGSVFHLGLEDLHQKAWPIARRQVEEILEDARNTFEQSWQQGKEIVDLSTLAHMAAQSRVRLMIADCQAQRWGQIDRATGELELSNPKPGKPTPEDVDLLDEIAEMVLLQGGQTFLVDTPRMPIDRAAVGVLR